MPGRITARAWRAGMALMTASVLAGCSEQIMDPSVSGPGPGPGETGQQAPVEGTNPAPAGNPLAGRGLFVEPYSPARETAAAWRSSRPSDAALMEQLARTPQAVWFTGWRSDPAARVREVLGAASAAGTVPVFVLYNIPQRDCGSYSAGGSGSADGYRSWVRTIAQAVGSAHAVFIVEPDALAAMDCLSATDRRTRVTLLSDAVALLKAQPNAVVYLDGGHPRWHDSAEMASRLSSAGIDHADGFALNVSNFVPSAENVQYGEAISRRVGNKHFVIDTSRNGIATSSTEWCNPPGRGVGIAPTTSSGHPLVDALLWVKRPGESDGACNGGPSAGVWWPEYALGLMERGTMRVALN